MGPVGCALGVSRLKFMRKYKLHQINKNACNSNIRDPKVYVAVELQLQVYNASIRY